LPGCKSTATTSTMHERMNSPYKIYVSKFLTSILVNSK
jgi:hypothetical protein